MSEKDVPAWNARFDVPGYGEVSAYFSDTDGVLVVEIDTPETSVVAGTADFDTVPRIRVYINSDLVWKRPAD